MSLRIKRYHSNESDYTRTGRNKATFDIPPSAGFTDLTQSRLILDMRLDVTNSTGAASNEVPATFGIGGEMVGPKALLRHSRVKSRQHGLLSERRHINVIDSNLDWYQSSRDWEDAQSLLGNTANDNYGIDRSSFLPDSPFMMIRRPKQGETLTAGEGYVTRRAEIPIPLRHIDQMASIKQFPNVAVGELHYEIEFEDQFNVAYPTVLANRTERFENLTGASNAIGTAANPLVSIKTVANWNRPPQVGDRVSVQFIETTTTDTKLVDNQVISAVAVVGNKYSLQFNAGAGIATTDAAEACTDISIIYDRVALADIANSATATFGSAANPVILENQAFINDKGTHHMIPYFVGQSVRLVAEHNPGTGATLTSQNTTITELSLDGDKLKVVVATPINVTSGQPIAKVTLANRDWDTNNSLYTVTWTVDEAYIELVELQLTPQQQESARKALSDLEIPWMEQRLLQKDMPATGVHTDVVHALPNCAGLAVLTPQNLRLLSGWDDCERYRFAINGIETTNRDIVVYDASSREYPRAGRQLHNHLLKKYWANLGKALSKYDANVKNYSAPDDERNHAIFPLVTPLVGNEQTIQLQLFSDNSTMQQKSIFFVFTHPRVLKISNGNVMVR